VTEGAAGAKRQRIDVTLALEALGADLREAFDVFAHRDEVAQAGEEDFERTVAGRRVSRAVFCGRNGQACDLAGAVADDGVQGGVEIVDEGFEIDARLGVLHELRESLFLEDLPDDHREVAARSHDTLTHRVSREECAQDDPEQLHRDYYKCARSPAESAQLHPTNFRA
jgi:hypothetical protein